MRQLVAIGITIAIALVSARNAMAEEWMAIEKYAASKQVAAEEPAPAPQHNTYFQITMQDVEKKVSEAMVEQGIAEHVETNVMPSGTPILYKANHPIQLVINSLQVDPDAKRWQAQAFIVSEGKTETVRPIAGRYDELIKVPMLTRQISNKDVIDMTDLDLRLVASRKLRKDTVVDVDQVIGKTARRNISAHRMMRMAEIVPAITIEKDHQVEMVYNTPYMSIRTMGKALESGTTGELIRVMNNDTQRTVSAKVLDNARVEVSPTTVIN